MNPCRRRREAGSADGEDRADGEVKLAREEVAHGQGKEQLQHRGESQDHRTFLSAAGVTTRVQQLECSAHPIYLFIFIYLFKFINLFLFIYLN